ncbi:MAG: dipeptidase [Gammaproteobacteria bacterium]|nr:dipeptidase [Gammaproteobacteria bacterium]
MKKFLAAIAILLIAALVYAHWFLPARVEGGQNLTRPHNPWPVSDGAAALHQTLFIADLHSDSLLWKRNFLKESAVGHMDLPRLQRGNVALQVFSATTKSPSGQNYNRNEAASSDTITQLAVGMFWPPRTWNSLYERAVYQLEKLHRFAAKSELTVITTRREMQELVERRERGERTVGAIYLIEGAHPLEGDVDKLNQLFDQGLRIVGLTHFFDNELGGSLHGVSGEGLTEFGRAVIRRANELGMIIDIAHSSPAMVDEVLELSSSPVILSHGGVKGICDTARNLSDAQMVRIARHDGILGVGFWDAAVCDFSPAGVAKAMRYAVDLMGIENVALGSDYDGATEVLFDVGELAALTEALMQQSFSEGDIRLLMGENVKRFLLENLPD